MNLAFLDPIQRTALPDQVLETLDDGGSYRVTCMAFSRRGAYLAVGGHDGRIVVWDFDTKSVAKLLIGHVRPVTCISWSYCGRYLATSSLDWVVRVWDLQTSMFVFSRTFPAMTLSCEIQQVKGSTLLLVSLFLTPPVLVDYTTGEARTVLESADSDDDEGMRQYTASFTPDGRHIYVGGHDGSISVLDTSSLSIITSFSLPQVTRVGVKSLSFSREAHGEQTHLLVNCSDKCLRLYSVPEHTLLHELSDPVNRVHWKSYGFVGEDYVIAEKAEHKVYFFSRHYGQLVKTLEGLRESVLGLAWHPIRNVIVSFSSAGILYVWGRQLSENWSAYAPGFTELEENEDYVEKEDEFDDMDDEEGVKKVDEYVPDLNEPIDIVTAAEEIDEDFRIPVTPIADACYIPDAFKTPLLVMGPKSKRIKTAF